MLDVEELRKEVEHVHTYDEHRFFVCTTSDLLELIYRLQATESEIKRAVEFGFITDELKMIADGKAIPTAIEDK